MLAVAVGSRERLTEIVQLTVGSREVEYVCVGVADIEFETVVDVLADIVALSDELGENVIVGLSELDDEGEVLELSETEGVPEVLTDGDHVLLNESE